MRIGSKGLKRASVSATVLAHQLPVPLGDANQGKRCIRMGSWLLEDPKSPAAQIVDRFLSLVP